MGIVVVRVCVCILVNALLSGGGEVIRVIDVDRAGPVEGGLSRSPAQSRLSFSNPMIIVNNPP